jgi:hypothetical protein
MTGHALPSRVNKLRDRRREWACLLRPDFFRQVCACCCIAASIAGIAFHPLPAMAADPVVTSDVVWHQPMPQEAYAPFMSQNSALHAEAVGEPYGYNWRGAAVDQPDWRGVRRDVSYFLGYQFAAIAVLYVAPESISGWDREQKRNYSFSKWRNNVSKPVWDEDRWWVNYITHPYWGGAYYIQARERGLDRAQAFWYSALLSTLFEYGAEALAEPVSAQDLVVTPVVGFLVGEYLFAPLRERIRAKPGKLDWSDKTLLFVTDPLGVLSAQTDRWLGVETTLRWQPIGLQTPVLAAGMDHSTGSPPGYPRSAVPVWGLQFRADW